MYYRELVVVAVVCLALAGVIFKVALYDHFHEEELASVTYQDQAVARRIQMEEDNNELRYVGTWGTFFVLAIVGAIVSLVQSHKDWREQTRSQSPVLDQPWFPATPEYYRRFF